MARELILIPKRKYEELLVKHKSIDSDVPENNVTENATNDVLEKSSHKATKENSNNNQDLSEKKDMKGGKLYIKTTPTDFAKELGANKKQVKRKWLSFKI